MIDHAHIFASLHASFCCCCCCCCCCWLRLFFVGGKSGGGGMDLILFFGCEIFFFWFYFILEESRLSGRRRVLLSERRAAAPGVIIRSSALIGRFHFHDASSDWPLMAAATNRRPTEENGANAIDWKKNKTKQKTKQNKNDCRSPAAIGRRRISLPVRLWAVFCF